MASKKLSRKQFFREKLKTFHKIEKKLTKYSNWLYLILYFKIP